METWRPDFSSPLPDLLRDVRESTDRILESMVGENWSGRLELREPARYSLCAGGKRIRPSLVVLSAYACVERPFLEGVPLLRAASTMELIHTYSLIHDDLPCMDDDDLRRGVATCHVRYGVETAMKAGTALLIEGFTQLSRTLAGTPKESPAVAIVGQAAGFSGMVGGQWLDLMMEGHEPTEAAVREIHLKKTAALIAGCCALGGLLGNADNQEQRSLTQYGLKIGLVFQAIDDLLDVVGQETTVGKKTGKDLDAGKLTMTQLRGISGTKEVARELVEDAAESVRSLNGPAASCLVALGYHLLERTH